MDYIYVIVGGLLFALLWFLARRGETKRLRSMGLLDADALRSSDQARIEGWSGQYRGQAPGGWSPHRGGGGGDGGVGGGI